MKIPDGKERKLGKIAKELISVVYAEVIKGLVTTKISQDAVLVGNSVNNRLEQIQNMSLKMIRCRWLHKSRFLMSERWYTGTKGLKGVKK